MDVTKTIPKRSWPVRIAKWVILCGAGLIYACLFGEIFLRVMDPQIRMPRYITGTDYGIRGNIPNSVYRQITPEANVEMRINGQGMRSDRDFPWAKPAGVCRVALLGDSYFMGYEAHYEDTIGALLETRLAEEGYRVEVLNFAVSGFSTEEMLRVFEAKTIKFEPDIIVSQFGAGDFADNMRPRLYRLDDNGVPQPTNRNYLPGVEIRDFLMQSSFYRMLINHSHLYSGFREWAGLTVKKILTQIGNARQQKPKQTITSASSDGPTFRQIQTRYTSALLMLSRERAEAFDMEWFLFEVPVPIHEAYRSSVDELDVDAATLERVITPIEKFDAHPRTEPWLYRQKGHSHFSESGHRLSTESLVEGFLGKAGAVFEGCPA